MCNVVTAGKGGNPRHFSDAFFHIRQLAAFCLVLQSHHLHLSDITML
jgi:hypothetical protein